MGFFNAFKRNKMKSDNQQPHFWYNNVLISQNLISDMPSIMNHVQCEYNLYDGENVELAVNLVYWSKYTCNIIFTNKFINFFDNEEYKNKLIGAFNNELDSIMKMDLYSDDKYEYIISFNDISFSEQANIISACLKASHYYFVLSSLIQSVANLLSEGKISDRQIYDESQPEDVFGILSDITNTILSSCGPNGFYPENAFDFEAMKHLQLHNRTNEKFVHEFFQSHSEWKNKYVYSYDI